MANEMIKTANNNEDLFSKVSALIEQTRSYVKTSVNTAEVYTKYYIGKYIVEYEQKGNIQYAIRETGYKGFIPKADRAFWDWLVISKLKET